MILHSGLFWDMENSKPFAEEVNMDWDMVVFGDFTLKQLAVYGGGIIALLVVISFVRKMFRSEEDTSEHVQLVRCKSCGWQGKVSRYVGRCPKCNEPLGDRRAKPQK
ncbi:MAG: hypothetical protein ACOC3W_07935 [Thermodesulfobacteriota bacterium]